MTNKKKDSSDDLSDAQVNATFADIEKQFSDDFGAQLDDNLIDPHFNDELEGILGNKAKVALLLTNVAKAGILAAFCKGCGIDAHCVEYNQGSFAILRDLEDDGPEQTASIISRAMEGVGAILCVNRADRLKITIWFAGECHPEEQIAPLFLEAFDPTIEDLLIGVQKIEDLDVAGYVQADSRDFRTNKEAKEFLMPYMEFLEDHNDEDEE